MGRLQKDMIKVAIRFPGDKLWTRRISAPGHRLAPSRGPPADRDRLRVDRRIRTGPAGGQAVLHHHRLDPGPEDLHDRATAGHLHRIGWPSVSATNLQRVLSRRGVIEPTPAAARPTSLGGRPATLQRFTARTLVITNLFAVFRPHPTRPPLTEQSSPRPWRLRLTVDAPAAARTSAQRTCTSDSYVSSLRRLPAA